MMEKVREGVRGCARCGEAWRGVAWSKVSIFCASAKLRAAGWSALGPRSRSCSSITCGGYAGVWLRCCRGGGYALLLRHLPQPLGRAKQVRYAGGGYAGGGYAGGGYAPPLTFRSHSGERSRCAISHVPVTFDVC